MLAMTFDRMHASTEDAPHLPKIVHEGPELQTHMHSSTYHSDVALHYLSPGDHTTRRKFNPMTRRWLMCSLRSPCYLPCHIGVATIIVATDIEISPRHARSHTLEFNNEFKVLRGAKRC